MRWAIGYRTNRLGDYLLRLGDRICGDKPMGSVELMDLGERIGLERRVAGMNITAAGVADVYAKLDDGRTQQLLDLAMVLGEEQGKARD